MIIELITDADEKIKRIQSNLEKRVRDSGGSRATESQREPEDQHEGRFVDHLNKYWAEVITGIREAESILLTGPGEAKIEFKKHWERENLGGRIIGVETADKMMEPQIATKARQRFAQKKIDFNNFYRTQKERYETHNLRRNDSEPSGFVLCRFADGTSTFYFKACLSTSTRHRPFLNPPVYRILTPVCLS